MGKVGIITRRGEYRGVLREGAYWLFLFDEVTVYDMSEPFNSSINLNILLQDTELKEMLEIVEVADHELALMYKDGIFSQVLAAGRYAFWKGLTEYSFVKADLTKVEITEDIDINTLTKPQILQFVRVYVVDSNEKGLLYKNGKFYKELEPGMYYFWENATPLSLQKADLRQQQMEISGQEILSKDKASLRINFNLIYQIVDMQKALVENKGYERQLYIATQLQLREFVGTLTLDELLERKESVSDFVLKGLATKAEALGLQIRECGIKDLILPGDVKEIMNKVMVAQKNAQANIITRREEIASTRSLLNTSKLMEDNAMLFRLKEMEYMEKIADKINSISVSGGNQIVDQLREMFS
jgi:regulator of protease activity HflC (stomatin/prohibitin superfamily)